ncbi:GAP family protein [Kitasatospora sp. NBC_01300]|uniref:GAP family protein n=1 Tax=Kitasatospora sp. NBC_01300 TaxID=2903574 RepID=UPI002F9070E4|nr:GAP family protein [Kitasatospora sp. NBC_01300]
MNVVLSEVTPLALVIALSPLPIVPALFLLFTPRPRAAGGAFLVGWAAGILVVASVSTALAAVIETREETPTWASWTKAVLGVVLVLLAGRQWRSGSKTGTPAWMRSLTDATPARALRLGLLLSAANPKNILLSAAAGLTIGSAELGPSRGVTAVAVFTAIAASTVALPLLLHIVAGERVLAPLGRARRWLETHNSAVTALVLAVIGVLLVVDGVTGL